MMVHASGLSPSCPQLLASMPSQVFWEAEQLSRESFRLHCPSDKDLENPLRMIQSKDRLLKESHFEQKWSGCSTAIVVGHWPGESIQKSVALAPILYIHLTADGQVLS